MLLLGAMYLVGLPVAFVYACLIEVVIRMSGRLTIITLLVCAFVTSVVEFPPMLVLAGDSDDPVRDDLLLRVFASAFMPVLLAGIVCWRIAPALHRWQAS